MGSGTVRLLCQGLEVFKAFSRSKRASLAGELAVNRVNFSGLLPRANELGSWGADWQVFAMAWVTPQQWRRGVFIHRKLFSFIVCVPSPFFHHHQEGGGSAPTVTTPNVSFDTNAPLSPTVEASGMARSDGETHGDESREQYFDPSLEAVEDHAFDDLMEASAQGGLSESERTSSTPSSLCCFCRY